MPVVTDVAGVSQPSAAEHQSPFTQSADVLQKKRLQAGYAVVARNAHAGFMTASDTDQLCQGELYTMHMLGGLMQSFL